MFEAPSYPSHLIIVGATVQFDLLVVNHRVKEVFQTLVSTVFIFTNDNPTVDNAVQRVVTQFAMFACWHNVADGLWRQSYGMSEPAHF